MIKSVQQYVYLIGGDSARFTSIFLASSFFYSQAESDARPSVYKSYSSDNDFCTRILSCVTHTAVNCCCSCVLSSQVDAAQHGSLCFPLFFTGCWVFTWHAGGRRSPYGAELEGNSAERHAARRNAAVHAEQLGARVRTRAR